MFQSFYLDSMDKEKKETFILIIVAKRATCLDTSLKKFPTLLLNQVGYGIYVPDQLFSGGYTSLPLHFLFAFLATVRLFAQFAAMVGLK